MFGLADLADHRMRPLQRPEGSLAWSGPRAPLVGPDLTRAGLGQRIQERVDIAGRYIRNDLVLGIAAVSGKRLQVCQPDGFCQGVRNPGIGRVGVRVGCVEGRPFTDETMDQPALGVRRREAVDRREKQGMVSDQEVGAPAHCLVDHSRHWINREEDFAYVGFGITADEPHGVPRRSQTRVVQGLDRGYDVGEARHGSQATDDGGVRSACGANRPHRVLRGGPGRARTADPWCVRPVLCPAELQAPRAARIPAKRRSFGTATERCLGRTAAAAGVSGQRRSRP